MTTRDLLDDRRVLLPVLLTAIAIAIGSALIVILSPSSSDGAAAGSSVPATSSGSNLRIDIADFKYRPVSVTVKSGSKVTWVNHDAAPHTATARGAEGFDTDTLKQGETATVTLDKPGTYAYICTFHPFMKATVTVR